MRNSLLKAVLIAVIAVCVCGEGLFKNFRRMPKFNNGRLRNNPSNDVVFVHHPLPCSYILDESITVEGPGFYAKQLNKYFVRGNNFKIYQELFTPQSVLQEVALRFDQVLKDNHSDKVFVAYFAGVTNNNMTSNMMLEAKEAKDEVEGLMDTIIGNQTFINETTTVYDGKKCKMYYGYDDEQKLDVYLYATLDNYMIALNMSSSVQGVFESFVYTYSFDAPLASFALSEKNFSGMNDTRAFLPLRFDPCPQPSELSSSSGIVVHFPLWGIIVIGCVGVAALIAIIVLIVWQVKKNSASSSYEPISSGN